MITMKQAEAAHLKRFGCYPVIIGLVCRSTLPKAIARAVMMGQPYDEREMMTKRSELAS